MGDSMSFSVLVAREAIHQGRTARSSAGISKERGCLNAINPFPGPRSMKDLVGFLALPLGKAIDQCILSSYRFHGVNLTHGTKLLATKRLLSILPIH